MLHNFHHFLRFYFVEFGQHPRKKGEKLKFGIGFAILFWIGLGEKNNKQIDTNFISRLTSDSP